MITDRDGDFNFALLLAVPPLFAGWGLYQGVANQTLTTGHGAILSMVAIISAACLGYILWNQRQEDRFRSWIRTSVNELVGGTARWNDIPVTLETPICRFRAPISLVVISYLVYSRPFVVDREPSRSTAIGHMIVASLCGWWSIWGPFRTAAALVSNLRGGEVVTLGDYARSLTPSVAIPDAAWVAQHGNPPAAPGAPR